MLKASWRVTPRDASTDQEKDKISPSRKGSIQRVMSNDV